MITAGVVAFLALVIGVFVAATWAPERTVAELKDRWAPPPSVVGAVAYPSRVEKLILVDAVGYPAHPASVPIGFRLVRLPVINWLLKNTLPRSLVEQGLRNVFGDPNKVTREMVDRAVELNQRQGN